MDVDFGTDRDPSFCLGLLSGLDITRLQCMFPPSIKLSIFECLNVRETDCASFSSTIINLLMMPTRAALSLVSP